MKNDAGDLLVRGGTLLTADGMGERVDIHIQHGKIARVGQVEPLRDTPVLDASAHFVIPGLVNAHTHSGENFNPGTYENLPLDLWFIHSHEITRSAPLSADSIYVRTLLGGVQMLRTGTTSVVDFLFESPQITMESLDPVVRAYRDLGLRATIVLGVADKPFLHSLPLSRGDTDSLARTEAPAPSLESIMELAREAVERWHVADGRIRIGLGPSAPQRCSDHLLVATMELARSKDLVWHTHVQETKTQVYTALQWHGKSFIRVLDALDLLGPRTTLIHTVWLTPDDIDVMRRTGTSAVHCPCSNLRLGDGIADLPELRRAGVTVALGTDGRGCDESLDLLHLARMTALLHKVHGESFEQWVSASDVLAMATSAGSRCAGYGEELGRLEVGAAGDLFLLPRGTYSFVPLNDAVRQLVYGAPSASVDAVVVAGKIVLNDGHVQGVDLDSLFRDGMRFSTPYHDAAAPPNQIESLVRTVYDAAEAADVGIDAYITRRRGT